MGLAEGEKNYTVEQYLQMDDDEYRYEFYKNELFPVEATTRKHNNIVQNISSKLRAFFVNKGCEVLSENVKLEAQKNVYYPYPDVMLTCDPEDNNPQYVTKPTILVEVLSPSTAEQDRGFKWAFYRKISSLRYYLLVSQEQVMVELFSRTTNTALWTFQEFNDTTEIIQFPDLDFQLSVADVYEFIIL